ncbi:ADAMTS-like protein 3 isoform X4 [Bos indicus x Bos taurus]|uniref:ADAMTS-like protein 3 isoform X4 n=1 Tax=Bos indicus x Bos taurus TaxID=30522 RepID=UPI000F7D4903|nr:ADAMTS-like protein 3 isoform X4 [Bos indicus x Bos taurus]
MASRKSPWWLLMWLVFMHSALLQTTAEKSPGAYFLPEFALSPQGSFLEDTTGEQFLTYRYDDQTSRNTRSDEEKDSNWDAWGDWSDCSRTCGGGASYSLRRCLTGRNCEGQNIRYKTCSNHDCPPDAEDFRAQQCSAYNDVQYQGRYYEWLPQYNDPAAPCALRCQARGQNLVVELAPKVLDGTRCTADSLDMCISGICQAVGCDRQLGSNAKEDNCGVCAGDGATCRLVRGQSKSHVSPEKREENVIAVPLGSRSVRITVKGPAHLFIESKTLQGSKGEHSFNSPGVFVVENTTVEFQKGSERQTFKIPGPLMADFIFKTRYTVAKDSVVQFFFYQPISHQWRQTDFFPCTVTCGGEKSPVEAKLPWLKQAQELEETRIATEEPTFVPEPWSACSATCGPGVQVREVKCRVLLTFTQTETELPEEECEGPRLPTERPCLLQPCDESPAVRELAASLQEQDSETTYDWEYAGFTPCTATCLGGHQEAIAVCLHLQTQQTVNDTLCDMVHRPPAMSQACNTEPCPPRWHMGSWGPCSATCGVGIQTREVYCLHPGESPSPPEECRDEKPHALQACNQFDCPPSWHIEEWQQCSRTCGGGTQNRRVTCRQLLTDGSFLNLSEELCQGPKASSRKSCARTDCPPHWTVGDWSKCSVSCGVGTQRRQQMCQKLTAKGRRVPLSETLCRHLSGPPLVRSCQMPVCGKMKPEMKARVREQGPQILGVQRVYIQTREEKRINLTVGSRAYLLPNTSVIIKCPVRRFQKSRIQWEKDGRCLQNSKRLGFTKSGSLKIHSLAALDIGEYRCIAGPAQETVVLKLIGTDNRLIAPPALGGHTREYPGMDNNEANNLGATWHKMRLMWNNKNELYLHNGQINNQSLLRALLGHCSPSAGNANSWEFENKQFEAAVKQGAYSMETAQFDELIRNMSQLMETGEISDDLASQVIYQLVAELTKVQPAHAHWRGIPGEAPPTAQLRGETGSVPQSSNSKNSGKLTFKPKGPVLLRQSQPTLISFNKTVNSRIGNTVYITRRTEVINILCELVSPSEATYTWTKDGALLQPSEKVILDGMGKMQIRKPTKKDQGIYGCAVANHLGSDVESSSVLYAEAPVILSVGRNITRPERGHLSIVIGSFVEAPLQANVTIQCPVKGVPQPNVTWLKKGGSLSDNISLLFNGSLLLQNLSLENEGTYVCTATNALGKAMATSVLHLLETFWELGNWTHCSATCGHLGAQVQRPQCLMANGQEVSEAFCDQLRKPQAAFQPCNIQDCPPRWLTGAWSECSVSCGEGFRSRQVTCKRTRANGTVQALPPRVCILRDRPLGRRPCSSHPCVQGLFEQGNQCPGRCLGRIVRMQQHHIICQHPNSSESGCDDTKRPIVQKNCLLGACDACWRAGPWKPCTTACGRGFQSRKVDCVHPGSCKPVTKTRCAPGKKPASWQHCLGPSCDRDCTDTTHYCTFVKHLHLCSLDRYKRRCCQSCQEG